MSKASRSKKPILAAVVIVIIVLAGVGVYFVTQQQTPPTSATSSTSATQTAQGTLVMDDTLWPANDLNVLYSFQGTPFPDWGLDSIYQSLVNVNETLVFGSGTTQYLPALADNWTVSPDDTTYTFNLQPGVTFSNGDPFNAYQVWAEMYLQYYLSGNSSAWLESYSVFDMSPVNFGPSTVALLTQSGLANPTQALLGIMENSSWPIYVTGPSQIVFRVEHPFLYFLGLMIVFAAGTIFDVQYVLDNGGPGTPAAINSYFNTNAIPGTGPYMISGMSVNTYVSYVQNPTYWDRNITPQALRANPFLDPGHVAKVIIYYRSDDVARYADLTTGKAQIVAISAADWNAIVLNPAKYSYLQVPKYSTLYVPVSLNTNLYPTNITDVRQAIVHAINYTDLVDKAFEGQGQELTPPEYPMYQQFYNLANLPPYQYNLTLAKQYLAKAGISNLPPITYYMPNDWSAGEVMGEVIQGDLAQIGITMNIELVTYGDYASNFGGYSYNVNNTAAEGHMTVCGGFTWGPSELTPVDAWVDFLSNRSTWGNSAVYSNPVVEKAIDAFFSSNNVTYIQSQVEKAQVQIYNDAPLITIGLGLWYGNGSLAWQKGVVQNQFLVDPLTTGEDTMPIFNTVSLG